MAGRSHGAQPDTTLYCRGAQGAIIRRRISDGVRLGCELFAVETARPLPKTPLVSFRNLCRQGFHLAYLRESWRLQLR